MTKYSLRKMFSLSEGWAQRELHRVIASSLSMLYVSYFEGFGIPIVEAFYCDVPVITSNVTSMPEVAGDAAILTDPFSFESISNAMVQIATDEKLRTSLIEREGSEDNFIAGKNQPTGFGK